MPDPSNYDAAFLQKRVSSGPDKNRAATADQLVARAKAGDQAALRQLADFSGGPMDPTPGNEWATADARNYGKLLLSQAQPGYTPQYDKAHDGGGLLSGVGHALGSALKFAAPIAGMAIPGLGPLAGAAIAGLGSAAGGALHGDKFNLGKTLLAGAAGGAGQALGGVKGISKLAGLNGGPSGITASSLTPQGIMASGGGVQGAVSGGGGILGKLGGVFKGANGGLDLGKVASTGAAVGGFIDARKQQGQANKFNNARLAQINHVNDLAEQDYAARQPARNAGYSRLAALGSQPAGSSIYGRAA